MIKDKKALLQACNAMRKGTLMETLEIEFTAISENEIVAKMPVTPKVHQPDGILHGGATLALAESVGSVGAFLFLNDANIKVRGIEISGNHVKSISEGFVFAKAKMVHKGRTIQLWHIAIVNEKDEAVSFVKLTTICIR